MLLLYCNDHSDIDECVEGSDGCDHNCTNTNGSYYCTCTTGYELELNNSTCVGKEYGYVYVSLCNFKSLLLRPLQLDY